MDMAISGPTPWNTPSMQDPKFKDEYWDRASTAMVNVVSGTVYVMLRGGFNDPITHPGTVWTRKVCCYRVIGNIIVYADGCIGVAGSKGREEQENYKGCKNQPTRAEGGANLAEDGAWGESSKDVKWKER